MNCLLRSFGSECYAGSGPPRKRRPGPAPIRGHTITAMTGNDRSLELDASREEALDHAARLVAEAWRSFDRFRPEEPPLDERVRRLLESSLPEQASAVHGVLDDAARILDESIAQARPRYFAFIGSSGLEIGAIADLEVRAAHIGPDGPKVFDAEALERGPVPGFELLVTEPGPPGRDQHAAVPNEVVDQESLLV